MANQTILVANDDLMYLDMIREVLVNAGYPHVFFHDGQGAFHRIRAQQPSLVLLDINLANPDRGWQTLEIVKLHPKTAYIPVILCSTDIRLIETKVDMLREMRCDYLEKPFSLETLLKKISEYVGPPSASRSSRSMYSTPMHLTRD